MMRTPLEFLTGVITSALIFLVIFVLIKKFTRLITPKVMRVMKDLLAFYILAIIGSGVGQYLIVWSLPQPLQQGFRLIEKHSRVTSQIGEVYGYSYLRSSIPQPEDDPARIIITLNGTKADIYLDILVTKDKNTKKWHLLEFKKDSLVQVFGHLPFFLRH